MKVRAKHMCFYKNGRKRPGEVFDLEDPNHFSKKHMEQVGEDGKPPKEKVAVKPEPKAEEKSKKPGKPGPSGDSII